MKLQIAIDDQQFEVEVEIAEDDTAPHVSYLPPHPVMSMPSNAVPATSPAATAGTSPTSSANEAKLCRSPIAGLVMRTNVRPGQQIQPNDLLVVLEAMKMETNVTAPAGGRVKTVTVNAGDAVQVNQVLVEFE